MAPAPGGRAHRRAAGRHIREGGEPECPDDLVTPADLDAEVGSAAAPSRDDELPFACVNVTNVVGVNLAIAVNAATINSQANALAMQYLASVQMP